MHFYYCVYTVAEVFHINLNRQNTESCDRKVLRKYQCQWIALLPINRTSMCRDRPPIN